MQVTFPDSSEKSDVVKIRGPKQDVDATYKYLQKLYKELLESSYSVKVSLMKSCPWLYRCYPVYLLRRYLSIRSSTRMLLAKEVQIFAKFAKKQVLGLIYLLRVQSPT